MLLNSEGRTGHFEQLDGFRFCSIAAVLLYHYASIGVIDTIPLGYGVLFFFVLSSFLITRILLITKARNLEKGIPLLFSLRQFYLRRAVRIFPIYYLLLGFLFLVNWKPCREIFFYLITYTTNFKIGAGYEVGSFIHLWSLAVEEQFYIFFPFVIFFIDTKHLGKVLIAMIVTGLLGRFILYTYNSENVYFSNFNSFSCLDSLGIGGILAYASIYHEGFLRKLISNKRLFAGAIVVFLTSMVFSYSIKIGMDKFNIGNVVFMRFFFNIMSFWVLGWAVLVGYKGLAKSFLENRVVVYLGRISYGLYLYHLFVPRPVSILLNYFNVDYFNSDEVHVTLLRAALYSMLTIAVASVSWYLIEKPFNNLKKYIEYDGQPSAKTVIS